MNTYSHLEQVIYVHIYTRMHIHTNIHTCMHTYIHTPMYVHVYMYIFVYMLELTSMHVTARGAAAGYDRGSGVQAQGALARRTGLYIYIYIYIFTYMYTYTVFDV